jgi:hypothetical protein
VICLLLPFQVLLGFLIVSSDLFHSIPRSGHIGDKIPSYVLFFMIFEFIAFSLSILYRSFPEKNPGWQKLINPETKIEWVYEEVDTANLPKILSLNRVNLGINLGTNDKQIWTILLWGKIYDNAIKDLQSMYPNAKFGFSRAYAKEYKKPKIL